MISSNSATLWAALNALLLVQPSLGVCLLSAIWAVASITLTAVELVVSSIYGGVRSAEAGRFFRSSSVGGGRLLFVIFI